MVKTSAIACPVSFENSLYKVLKHGVVILETFSLILILGIIALIAIPTVNKILTEAREGAFKTSVDNIMKTSQTQCQTSQIKNQLPITMYHFNNNKIY